MKKAAPIYFCLILVSLGLCRPVGKSFAADIQIQAAVDSREVFVGETFNFQIQVKGHDSPPEPDMSQVKNFRVRFLGGQQNSSTSISNVNGSWNKIVNRAYIFNYLLTPLRAGELIVPAISLTIDGKNYRTRPFSIHARKPEESDDFKLRQQLSKDHCYVGEPLVLTTTWYIGRDVKNFEFNLPLLDDSRFAVYSRKPDKMPASRDNLFELPAGSAKLMAVRGRGKLDGRSFTTLTVQQTIIPRRSGELSLPQATVSCKALSGYTRRRSRGFGGFDNDPFFSDLFGRNKQGVYQTQVIPANETTLNVIPLPTQGKPDNFSELIGVYRISTRAVPQEVNVGDPITLTIKVSGPFVDSVEPPSLAGIAAGGFKIPEEIAPGRTEGDSRVFTQTIRATNADIKEIPALELSFFNPETGSYETSRSRPITLTVHPTRIITALDAEGAAEPAIKKKIKTANSGINFNYDGPDVLLDRKAAEISTGSIIILLAGPPSCFLLLLGLTFFRRRNSDPAKARAKKAAAEFIRELDRMGANGSPADPALALKRYLSLKLSRSAAALTFIDIEPQLRSANISTETLADLQFILDQGEAAQYAGVVGSPDEMKKLVDSARQAVSELEKRLGK